VLIARSTCLRSGWTVLCFVVRCAVVRSRIRIERPAYIGRIERSVVPQRPGQCPPTFGEGQAAEVWMQVSTAPWQPSPPVGDEHAVDRYDPKEVGLRRSPPAADTRAHRGGAMSKRRVYSSVGYPTSPPAAAGCAAVSLAGGSASDLMSIRQPVRRAASRAFCPSLPIASESW